MTAGGKPIAKAKTPALAEDIADRLNEDDCRKSKDRWSLDLACGSRRLDDTLSVSTHLARFSF